MERRDEPVEGSRKHQVIVDRQFVQSLCKITLVYQSTRLIDDDQCVDDPIAHCQIASVWMRLRGSYIAAVRVLSQPDSTGSSDSPSTRRFRSACIKGQFTSSSCGSAGSIVGEAQAGAFVRLSLAVDGGRGSDLQYSPDDRS